MITPKKWITATLLILTATSLSHATEMSCTQRLVHAEALIGKIWDSRKNAWASLTLPRSARNFDLSQFTYYRDLYLKQIRANETTLLPVTFESKLAFLEAMMDSKSSVTSNLGEKFESLPAAKKKAATRLIEEITADLDGGRAPRLGIIPRSKLTHNQVKSRVLNLQALLYESFYPKIFEGMGEETKLRTLEIIMRGRFLSRGLTQGLIDISKETGFYKESNILIRILRRELPGSTQFVREHFVRGMNNVWLNMIIAKTQMIASTVLGTTVLPLKVLPKIRLTHSIHIPESMWEEAFEIGLDPAWERTIKPYLSKKYGRAVQLETIYNGMSRVYMAPAYTYLYLAIGYAAYIQTKEIIDAMKLLKEFKRLQEEQNRELIENGSEDNQPLSRDDIDTLWQDWLKENPDATPEDKKSVRETLYKGFE